LGGYTTAGYSEEERLALKAKKSASATGKKHTAETRKKMSFDRSGGKSHMCGRKLPEETRAKMSASRTGKTHSEHTKSKIALAQTGDKGPMAKLTWERVRLIRGLYTSGSHSLQALAKENGLSISGVYHVIKNNSWYDPDYNYTSKSKLLTK
jgi:hypothetical protein